VVAESLPARHAIAAVAALDDTVRRNLYWFIRRAHQPVTREDAANAVGISRKLAAFHLDKLIDAGLLHSRPASPEGRRKVGRRPKVYEPTGSDVQVTIPERRHDLLAGVLIDALLSEQSGETTKDATVRVAWERGEQWGKEQREQSRPGRLGHERALGFAQRLLEEHGFEPSREDLTTLRLRNCPFHPLAARAPELVCGLNHAFLSGYLRGLEASTVEAVLTPRAGECCVELRATSPGTTNDD
jgi:predicted ArsR family transcriptional regulator